VPQVKQVTINDIAKHAGVGRATVDRVLNGRSSTKPETAVKVLKAAKELGYRVNQSNILSHVNTLYTADTKSEVRLGFILLSDTYSFYRDLAQALDAAAKRTNVEETKFVFFTLEQIEQVATSIINLAKEVDVIGLVSVDHPLVRHAVNQVTQDGTKVITLLSDLSACNQSAYIGWDNKKAGRTAAWAVQHFYPQASKIGIVIGDNRFLCQETCEISFRSYLRENGGQQRVLEPVRSFENIQDGYESTLSLLKANPDLTLLYAPCGGIEGIAKALKDMQMHKQVTFICHGPSIDQELRFFDDTIDMMLAHNLSELATKVVDVSKDLVSGHNEGYVSCLVDFIIKVKENI
jgi:LacI family transcriptional regulator